MSEIDIGTSSSSSGASRPQQPVPDRTGCIVIAGEFDAANAHELQSSLDHPADSNGELVLDCSGVLYMDSTALHLLIRAAHTLREAKARLVILSPSVFMRRLLEISGIVSAVNIEVREE